MAKDGTNRGGRRVRAGTKPDALAPYHLVSNKPEYITVFAENEVKEYEDQEYR